MCSCMAIGLLYIIFNHFYCTLHGQLLMMEKEIEADKETRRGRKKITMHQISPFKKGVQWFQSMA